MKKQGSINFTLFGFIFAMVGVITLIIGVFSIKSSIDLKNNSVEIIATISNYETNRDSDGDVHYTFYVDYSYEGQTYENIRLSSSSSTWNVGDDLKLLLDTRNPNRVQASSFVYFVPIICFIFTLTFGGVGLGIMITSIKKSKNAKNLVKNGKKSYVKVVRVEEDYSTTINGVHPLRVVCNLEDINTGLVYEVRSNSYMNIPINLDGYFVAIYIDVNNINNYYIDIDDVKVEENF